MKKTTLHLSILSLSLGINCHVDAQTKKKDNASDAANIEIRNQKAKPFVNERLSLHADDTGSIYILDKHETLIRLAKVGTIMTVITENYLWCVADEQVVEMGELQLYHAIRVSTGADQTLDKV